jgi:hypothetical protein
MYLQLYLEEQEQFVLLRKSECQPKQNHVYSTCEITLMVTALCILLVE